MATPKPPLFIGGGEEGAPPHKGPRRLGFGEGVLPPNLGGKFPLSPLGCTLDGFGLAAAPRGGTLGGGAAVPLPLYILEGFGAANI